jgi:hypothetical protein
MAEASMADREKVALIVWSIATVLSAVAPASAAHHHTHARATAPYSVQATPQRQSDLSAQDQQAERARAKQRRLKRREFGRQNAQGEGEPAAAQVQAGPPRS